MMQVTGSRTEFRPDEEAPLRPDEAGDFKTETFNQWVFDPVADIGLNIWFASGANGGGQPFPNFMSTIMVFVGDETWVTMGKGQGNHASGIAAGNSFLTMIEPFKKWKIDFLGLMSRSLGAHSASGFDNVDGRQLSALNLTVDILSPPIEQGSQGDRGETASSGTTPRTAIRYEQLCRIHGPMRIGERTFDIDAYGVRSHRRNSASIYDSGAVGHSWATATFPSGKGFHLLSYQSEPDAKVGFLYGHYFDGAAYRQVRVRRFPFFSGVEAGEHLRIQLEVEGELLAIGIDTKPPLFSQIPPQGVRLSRSPARFTLNGEVGGGVIERSLTPQFIAGGEYVAG